MKKHLFLLLSVFNSLLLFAQGQEIVVQEPVYLTPNYDSLKIQIADPQSRYYYPELLRRYTAADTTLEIDQVHALYYGAIFQPNFNPYQSFDQYESINKILGRRRILSSDKAYGKKLLNCVKLTDEIIAQKTTELKVYRYKNAVVRRLSKLSLCDPQLVSDTRAQYLLLFSAVTASGNGLDFEHAYHLASTMDSYEIMYIYDFSPVSQSLQFHEGRAYDVFQLAKNKYQVEALYFDVTECLKSMQP